MKFRHVILVDEDDPLTDQEVPPLPTHMEVDKHVRIQEGNRPLRK